MSIFSLLILVLTLGGISPSQPTRLRERLDTNDGQSVPSVYTSDFIVHDDPLYTWFPTRGVREKRVLVTEDMYDDVTSLRKKRYDAEGMEKKELTQLCRAARLDWPPCNLINVLWRYDWVNGEEQGERNIQVESESESPVDSESKVREERVKKEKLRAKRELNLEDFLDTQFVEDAGEDVQSDISLQEKRQSKFNPWGGKRNHVSSNSNSFSSWGGKRAQPFYSLEEKRAPAFSSWGGKRSPSFSSWGGKRGQTFSSWGGKRSSPFSSWGGKRAPAFSSWGGKRDSGFPVRNEKRAPKFSSWGGKRNPFANWVGKKFPSNDSFIFDNEIVDGEDDDIFPRVNSISSLSSISNGPEDNESLEETDSIIKRAKFSNWGGKRFYETGEETPNPDDISVHFDLKKNDLMFSPWAGPSYFKIPLPTNVGKRDRRSGRSRGKQIHSPPLRQNRRGADFYPWGGKRQDSSLPHTDYLLEN